MLVRARLDPVGHPLAAPGAIRDRRPMVTERAVTVLTVDDQAIFRRAARELIAATPGFEEIGQACSGPEALELAAERRPDLVLLDVRMPGMDGIETARRLLESEPDAVIVLISLEEFPDMSSVPAGVAATLRKQDLSRRALRDIWATYGRSRTG
jgi:two-component system invasion response regulator UvrY